MNYIHWQLLPERSQLAKTPGDKLNMLHRRATKLILTTVDANQLTDDFKKLNGHEDIDKSMFSHLWEVEGLEATK